MGLWSTNPTSSSSIRGPYVAYPFGRATSGRFRPERVPGTTSHTHHTAQLPGGHPVATMAPERPHSVQADPRGYGRPRGVWDIGSVGGRVTPLRNAAVCVAMLVRIAGLCCCCERVNSHVVV